MKVKVWKILGLVLIAFFALPAANASAYPTLSSLAGTYSNASTGHTITLYENGSALFDTRSGNWHIVNATTIEGSYTLVSVQFDRFTITNNGFIAVATGNVYVKTASASPSPTETATATASATSTASETSTPNVPEFSSVALILVGAAAVSVALCMIGLTRKKRHPTRP
jgi:hypothetical protein